eukprot:TRINITY_DN19536_c0_g1_i1.p1 TRINITY_DN19536_c0_g1~~TRINITY_DN19536_c0_g1_i1.p1  ORF type:complete len:195 (+),score=27.08 TRINITY_DN19536_c0_g1_i1:31-585(+)
MVGQKNPLFGGVRCGNFVAFSLQQYDRKAMHGENGRLRGTVAPAVVDKAIKEVRVRVPGTCERSRLARLECLASKLCSPQDVTGLATHNPVHFPAMMYKPASDSQTMTYNARYPQTMMYNPASDPLSCIPYPDYLQPMMDNAHHPQPMMCDRGHDSEAMTYHFAGAGSSDDGETDLECHLSYFS